MLEIWKAEGKTIIIAEHRLHYMIDIVDTFVIMEQGRIVNELVKHRAKVDLPAPFSPMIAVIAPNSNLTGFMFNTRLCCPWYLNCNRSILSVRYPCSNMVCEVQR